MEEHDKSLECRYETMLLRMTNAATARIAGCETALQGRSREPTDQHRSEAHPEHAACHERDGEAPWKRADASKGQIGRDARGTDQGDVTISEVETGKWCIPIPVKSTYAGTITNPPPDAE